MATAGGCVGIGVGVGGSGVGVGVESIVPTCSEPACGVRLYSWIARLGTGVGLALSRSGGTYIGAPIISRHWFSSSMRLMPYTCSMASSILTPSLKTASSSRIAARPYAAIMNSTMLLA